MNYTSDELEDIVYYGSPFEINIDKLIEDLVFLQDKLHPLGVLKDLKSEGLGVFDVKTLVLVHKLQSDLFAMKFFKECSNEPPSQNIFGIYV